MTFDLSEAKRVYETLCTTRLQIIQTAWSELNCSVNRPIALDRIRRESHKIRGVAGTFGHDNLGNLCQKVEHHLSLVEELGEVAMQDFKQVSWQLILALEEVVKQSGALDDGARMSGLDHESTWHRTAVE